MKKNYFLSATAAFGLFALASCSNEDDPISQQSGEETATGEQVIVLDMQDTDVLSTKSRPLYSTTNQGAELVTDVKLFVFEHAENDGEAMKLINVLTINNWDQNSSDYNYGRKYSLKLEGNDKLETGKTYTILAVGQDESDISATSFAPYKIFAGGLQESSYISTATTWSVSDLEDATWSAGSNNGEGFLLTDATTGRTNEAEIFSGISNPVDLNFDGGFTAEVLLKRQVAGVLGYFSKIPAIVSKNGSSTANWYENYDAVKAIRLVAHNKNTRIDLAHALYSQGDDATNEGDEYVVNGFTQAMADAKFKATTGAANDAYTVYQIDLNKWFAAENSSADDASYWFGTDITGSVNFEDGIPSLGEDAKYATTSGDGASYSETLTSPTWVNALSQSNSNPTVVTNSVLAGEFVIPFDKNTSTSNYTFELQLLGGENNKILKSWNVKLDKQSIDTDKGDNEYAFNIYRNHLYQIGKRGAGDDPVNPGTDPDKPQPLDKDQDLTIFINDQWEFIHDLEIE